MESSGYKIDHFEMRQPSICSNGSVNLWCDSNTGTNAVFIHACGTKAAHKQDTPEVHFSSGGRLHMCEAQRGLVLPPGSPVAVKLSLFFLYIFTYYFWKTSKLHTMYRATVRAGHALFLGLRACPFALPAESFRALFWALNFTLLRSRS